ncbi:MAG: GTP cyclohydrolase [Desulfuromonas sp.]|nr:GTP cyclohydrolase [Desulfuromonas sp.]
MFIVNLSYIRPLDEIDFFMQAHLDFLQKNYDQQVFIASGRKVPRNGGIIFAQAESREILEKIVAEDPFVKNKVASAEIIEFAPSMTLAGFEALKGI